VLLASLEPPSRRCLRFRMHLAPSYVKGRSRNGASSRWVDRKRPCVRVWEYAKLRGLRPALLSSWSLSQSWAHSSKALARALSF